jgi:hypothetical protein
MDDTSLEDFLSGDDSEETAVDADEPSSDTARSRQETDDPVATADESVAPARTTSRWDAGGTMCSACGETVQRVWDAPDGLVCATCKEW